MSQRKKLMLVVIDAMAPAMLEQTLLAGDAPNLAEIIKRGHQADCIAAFPSVTPVCSATIATGTPIEQHLVPSMNWYRRSESRYVEYGTSFKASQTFGFVRSLSDAIYNLNRTHLSENVETIFERLDDAGITTAGTSYLIYRGRHRHELSLTAGLSRFGVNFSLGEPVFGPKEFFYGNLFASRKFPCRSQFGMPGARDQHSSCVSAHLIKEDLCDFLLLSLPDNDTHSHRYGPKGQLKSIAAADVELGRVIAAVGTVDEFLDEYAVIICSDHAQSEVRDKIDLFPAYKKGFRVQPAVPERNTGNGDKPKPEIAVCPSSRAAEIYILNEDDRPNMLPKAEAIALSLTGVDLVMSLSGDDRSEAKVSGLRGELRFAPGGDYLDAAGRSWGVEGDLTVLELAIKDGRISSSSYPDALNRIWGALICETSGDLLLSAAPGYEFIDWGGGHHVGGGSHGSLHAIDSRACLIWCGAGPESFSREKEWTLQDIAPMVIDYFGL